MTGRSFAIGDVHGCDVALEVLLNEIRPSSADQIILLGDVIDRGPDSRRVIEMLMDLRAETRVVLVMGNHEEMLFSALDNRSAAASWYKWGGAEMLASYGGSLRDVPHEHLMFLDGGVPFLETDAHILIHANLEPGVPLEEQSTDWLRWQKLTGWERPHPSGKTIVCGHTPIETGVPLVRNGWIGIDTAAYQGLFLTALDLGTGEILQSQQSGTLRRGVHIDEL